jgi:hypothetical protein
MSFLARQGIRGTLGPKVRPPASRREQNHSAQRPRTTAVCTRDYRSGISALLTTKLLQDMVEVAAEDGHVGLVGPPVVGAVACPSFRPRLNGRGGPSRGLAQQRWLQDHPEDKISSSILQDGGRYGPVGRLVGAGASRDGQDVGCSWNREEHPLGGDITLAETRGRDTLGRKLVCDLHERANRVD